MLERPSLARLPAFSTGHLTWISDKLPLALHPEASIASK
jgi:hypothetical protein